MIIKQKAAKSQNANLLDLACNNTVAARDIGTGRRRDATAHSLTVLVQPPLRIRARNKSALGIPASDPVDAIIKKKEAQPLRATALVQGSSEETRALVELRLEHVAMQNAAVDQGSGDFFVLVVPVTADKVPALAGQEPVCSWDRSVPVLFAVAVGLDAITALEPVDGAADGAQAEEEVGSHDGLIKIQKM